MNIGVIGPQTRAAAMLADRAGPVCSGLMAEAAPAAYLSAPANPGGARRTSAPCHEGLTKLKAGQ